jgi:hypothetical protein
MRHYSFEDKQVGRGEGEFFKVTGVKERPQRIAYIPAVAYQHQLDITPELQKRAAAKDARAIEEIEDIRRLKENVTNNLKKNPPSAEIWTDSEGKKAIIYARTDAAKTFWLDGVGYVYWKDGMPDDLIVKPPQIVYGFVLLEYELNSENEPIILPPDRQIELGGGHKLNFKYDLKSWSINDAKTRAWKEHSRTNPVIKTDYHVWTAKEGLYDRTKFSPAGPALWREDPMVMQRIIKEAGKIYENLPKFIAKDFSVDEIVEMASGGQQDRSKQGAPSVTAIPEEFDFASLLGSGPAEIPANSDLPVLEQQPVIDVQPEFSEFLELSPESPGGVSTPSEKEGAR